MEIIFLKKEKIMSRFKLSLALLGLIGATGAYAGTICQDQYGEMSCGAGSVADVAYTGSVNLAGTYVSNQVNVLGNFSAYSAHINLLKVKGITYLNKSNINGKARVTGNVVADDSSFDNEVSIVGTLKAMNVLFATDVEIVGTLNCDKCIFNKASNITGEMKVDNTKFMELINVNARKIVFVNSKAMDITVLKPNDNKVQTVYLNSGSTVRNITFESQQGFVVLDRSSQVTGNVQGGKISVK